MPLLFFVVLLLPAALANFLRLDSTIQQKIREIRMLELALL